MVINLNEVYGNNLLYYWCNCVGEIHAPGYPDRACPSVDVLPPVAKMVYDDYRSEGNGAQEYVVTYNGSTGLMLGWLFDYSWLNDLGVLKPDNESAVKARLHEAVRAASDMLSENYDKLPVLCGIDTDPDGDEILLFLSSDVLVSAMNAIDVSRVAHDTGKRLYEYVEKALKAE